MALRLIGVDPDSPNNGSPTVWQCDDPAVAKLCAASFDAAWEGAIPHEAYEPA